MTEVGSRAPSRQSSSDTSSYAGSDASSTPSYETAGTELADHESSSGVKSNTNLNAATTTRPSTFTDNSSGSGTDSSGSGSSNVNPTSRKVSTTTPTTQSASMLTAGNLGSATSGGGKYDAIEQWMSEQNPDNVDAILQAAAFTPTREGDAMTDGQSGVTITHTKDASGKITHTNYMIGRPAHPLYELATHSGVLNVQFSPSENRGRTSIFVAANNAISSGLWKPPEPPTSPLPQSQASDMQKYFTYTTPKQPSTTALTGSHDRGPAPKFNIEEHTVPLGPDSGEPISRAGTDLKGLRRTWELVNSLSPEQREKFGLKPP